LALDFHLTRNDKIYGMEQRLQQRRQRHEWHGIVAEMRVPFAGSVVVAVVAAAASEKYGLVASFPKGFRPRGRVPFVVKVPPLGRPASFRRPPLPSLRNGVGEGKRTRIQLLLEDVYDGMRQGDLLEILPRLLRHWGKKKTFPETSSAAMVLAASDVVLRKGF